MQRWFFTMPNGNRPLGGWIVENHTMSDCCAEILTGLVAAGADVIERVARPGVSSRGRSTHV